MEKRLRIGIFPNLPKEKVRAILPKVVEFCRQQEIPIAFPGRLQGPTGSWAMTRRIRPVSASFPWP